MSATVVLTRGEEDLFVEVTLRSGKWTYAAYDENGISMILTTKELQEAIKLVQAGVDLTGR